MDSIMGLIIGTIGMLIIEAGVALLFGYCATKQIILIGITDLITHGAMNFVLYNTETLGEYIVCFIIGVFAVVIIEMTVYALLLNRFADAPREDDVATGSLVLIYTVVAHIASFGFILFI